LRIVIFNVDNFAIEFKEFIQTKSLYETIYQDSEGREILIITVFDAWQMMNAIKEKDERWVKSYCGGKPNYTKD
jgi:hypothetical protein